ncbi:MAG: RsmD family RNA methyltransferase, partial [Pseudomonadota bacterium]
KLMRENIAKLRRPNDVTVLGVDAGKLPAGEACQLVFLDPPYGQDLGGKALAAAKSAGWLAPDALIVWEESRAQIAPIGFTSLDQRRYGDTWVSFLRYEG